MRGSLHGCAWISACDPWISPCRKRYKSVSLSTRLHAHTWISPWLCVDLCLQSVDLKMQKKIQKRITFHTSECTHVDLSMAMRGSLLALRGSHHAEKGTETYYFPHICMHTSGSLNARGSHNAEKGTETYHFPYNSPAETTTRY